MPPKKLILLLTTGLLLLVSPARAAAWEDFNGGFETGDFSQYLEVQAAPERATIVTSPVAEGAYAARFERQVGDPLAAGSSRSEAVPAPLFGAGETLYFRHLLYLPYAGIDWKHFLILCQWHDSSGNPPPITLQTFEKEGVKKLRVLPGSQKAVYYEFNIPGDSQWFELVYRISFGVKGSMEVWLNGHSLGEVEGIDTLGTEPTNWKVGAYRDKEAEGTTVIYQDGVMITKQFFSNPPSSGGSAAATPVAGPPAPPASPGGNPTGGPTPACMGARNRLRKAKLLFSQARRHQRNSAGAQRHKSAKQLQQAAKRYQQAQKRAHRACKPA